MIILVMNIVRCNVISCKCYFNNMESFAFPPLTGPHICDCGHLVNTHIEKHVFFNDIWRNNIFPLVRWADQQALRTTCTVYKNIPVTSKHREYYRPCDICGKRIRRRHIKNTPSASSGIKIEGQYVHMRCLPN
jgi:hypothetical protein